MIAKEAFVAALAAIKGSESRWQWERRDPSEVALTLSFDQMEHLYTQLRLLRAAAPDPHGYIEKWLFETLKPVLQPDGTSITIPTDDPGALYDLLVKEASELPEEELPLRDLPVVDVLPYRAIRAVDFFNYFDAVLDYVKSHDVVIHITGEGKEDRLLLGAEAYQRLFSVIEAEEGRGDTIVEFSVDPEVEKAFRELIAPTGFTLEQMTQMFLCWCARYPEEATAWLKKAAEEQGVELEREAEQDTE